MADTYTTNLGLTKPGYDSPVDVGVLNANMDKIDNAVANAGKVKSVNGMTGDVVIDDVSKLNGKDSVYYLQPIEMLDNVDFAIAQAGYGGMHGAFAYASDRWYLQGGTFARNGEVNTLTCSESGFVQQKVNEEKGKLNGKAVTVAIVLEDGTVKVANATIPSEDVTGSTAYIAQLRLSTNAILILLKTTSQETIVRLVVDSGYSFSFKRIHLLVGTYTADNLPLYIPKGYAAELAECQRYFFQIGTYSPIGNGYSVGSADARIAIVTPVEMRNMPSLNDSFDLTIVGNGVSKTVTSTTVGSKSGNIVRLNIVSSGLTAGYIYSAYTGGTGALQLSADL